MTLGHFVNIFFVYILGLGTNFFLKGAKFSHVFFPMQIKSKKRRNMKDKKKTTAFQLYFTLAKGWVNLV